MPGSETRQLLPFLAMAPSVGISTVRTSRMAFGGGRAGGSARSDEGNAVFFGCVSSELYTGFKKLWMIIALVIQSVLLGIGLTLALIMLEDKYAVPMNENAGFAIMLITVAIVFLFSFVELTAYVLSYNEKTSENKLQMWHVAVYCIAAVLKLWLTGISIFCVIWTVDHDFTTGLLLVNPAQEVADYLTATSIVNAIFGLFATAFSAALFFASEAGRRLVEEERKKGGGAARA